MVVYEILRTFLFMGGAFCKSEIKFLHFNLLVGLSVMVVKVDVYGGLSHRYSEINTIYFI